MVEQGFFSPENMMDPELKQEIRKKLRVATEASCTHKTRSSRRLTADFMASRI